MNVLLVMHSEAEAHNVLQTWQQMGLICQPIYIRDTEDSSACLDHREAYAGQPDPDVVIVSEQLDQETVRELYCHKAGCFISTSVNIGEYLHFIEHGSTLQAYVLIFPNQNRPRRSA